VSEDEKKTEECCGTTPTEQSETPQETESEGQATTDTMATVRSWLGTVGETVGHAVSGLVSQLSQLSTAGTWVPATDVFTTESELVLLADVPGAESGEVDVEATGMSITISGKTPDRVEGAVRVAARGRNSGPFEKVVPLPAEIQHGAVKASMKRGVLEVRAPLAVGEKAAVDVSTDEG
jgi:HSP20 family protein